MEAHDADPAVYFDMLRVHATFTLKYGREPDPERYEGDDQRFWDLMTVSEKRRWLRAQEKATDGYDR